MLFERKSMLIAAAFVIATTAAATLPSAADPAAGAPKEGWHEKGPRHLPGEFIDARLAFLKTALKITDAQSKQWDAFAAVLRKHAKQRDDEIQAMRAEGDHPRPNAIEALEHRQQHMARAAANLSEMLEAAKPLYASFSDEQKQRADELLGHHEGWGHHRL